MKRPVVLRSAARLVLRLPSSSSISNLIREQLISQTESTTNCAYLHTNASTILHQSTSLKCDLVSSFPGRSQLRSASAGNLIVPVIREQTTIGTHSFFYSCPSVLNSLPSYLKNFELTLPIFKNRLKTYFFRRHYVSLWAPLRHSVLIGVSQSCLIIIILMGGSCTGNNNGRFMYWE